LNDHPETLAKNSGAEWNRGRARRLRALQLEEEQATEIPAQRGSTSKSEREVVESSEAILGGRIQLEQKLPNRDDMATLPVLFVLTPEEPAASPAASAPSPAAANLEE
jgi:hypothetical protein